MKTTLFAVAILFLSIFCGAQTNTFPISGNASIGAPAGSAALTIERNNNDGSANSATISIKNTNAVEAAGSSYNVAGINYFAGNGQVLGQVVANFGAGIAPPWSYGSGFYITTRTNHPIVFTTGISNTEKMRISENGGVSIGTNNSQGYAFAVNGSSIFTKIKIKQITSWPDYVFAQNYRLLSLTDLHTFIQKNRHLPGVPSADEVEKTGIDLGDMQSLLLKKIEELTLHLIELNRKNEQQQVDIEQLKSERTGSATRSVKLTNY